jgi:hypothetical protein
MWPALSPSRKAVLQDQWAATHLEGRLGNLRHIVVEVGVTVRVPVGSGRKFFAKNAIVRLLGPGGRVRFISRGTQGCHAVTV